MTRSGLTCKDSPTGPCSWTAARGADSITLVDNHDVAGSFTYTVTNATATRDQGLWGIDLCER